MKNKNNLIERLKKNALEVILSRRTNCGIERASRRLLKEILLSENNNIPEIKNNYSHVQIGGGAHLLKNFLNIDITPPADIIYDVREGLPLKKTSVNFIFCEHFLEHIDYPVSVKKFFKESYRVLHKKGRLVIGVPDSKMAVGAYYKNDKKLIKKYIESWYKKRDCLNHFNTPIDFLNYHFRDQDDNEKYNPHFWAYDKEKLFSLFGGAGFKKITIWKFDEKIANPKRKFGSLYVVGTKP